VVRKPLLLAAVVGASAFVVLPGSSAGAGASRTASVAQTFIMAAYIGPVDKPLWTVGVSGGVNPYTARNALYGKFHVLALLGTLKKSTIPPSKLTPALNAFAALKPSPTGSAFRIALYRIDMSTGKATAKRFNAAAGKAALTKLAASLPAKPAAAIKSLRNAAFP
jgi:hypothetical protein